MARKVIEIENGGKLNWLLCLSRQTFFHY